MPARRRDKTFDGLSPIPQVIAYLGREDPYSPLVPFQGGYLKLDNTLPGNSFKWRGVRYALARLDKTPKNVVVVSTGNFAMAVVKAASMMDPPPRIHVVMPRHPDPGKVRWLSDQGAFVTEGPAHRSAYNQVADELTQSLPDAVHLTSGESPDIISGHATSAREVFESIKKRTGLRQGELLVPLGSGGNMAAAIWAREQSPEFRNWKIIGVEPATADRYHQSINSHRRVEVVHDSVCDGAAAPQLSKRSYDIIRAKGNGVVTVSDDDVLEAMDRLWREGHIVEPTAALGVAAWSQFPRSGDYPVATFMTGGNVTRVHEAELQAYRKESGALLSPIRSLVAERLIS